MNVEREAASFHAYQRRPSRGALAALLKLHQNRIYNICFQVLAHPEDAEDASQEVLMEAARCLSNITDARAFRAWLYRVALTTSLNIRRSRARRAELARTAPIPSGAPAMDRVERDAFMQAIADLDEPTRSLLLEHYFEKATLEELARREGVSAVAIWKRLELAKERLRIALAGAGFSVVAAGVAHSLELITPVTAPSLLITDAVLGSAAWMAAGGAAVATKSAITSGMIIAGLVIAGTAGSGGYLIGVQRARPVEHETSRNLVNAPPDTDSFADKQLSLPASAESALSQREQIEEVLRQIKADWRVALRRDGDLTRFDSDLMFDLLKAAWPDLPVEARQQILKRFGPDHPRVLDVLDLGMQTIDGAQGWAVNYLKSFAFRNFTNDDEGYKEWRAKTAGRPVEDVRRESARDLVLRMGNLAILDAEQLGRFLQDCARGSAAVYLNEAGFPAAIERLLASTTPVQAKELIEPLRGFALDEAFLRRAIVPYLDHPDTVHQALGVLGKKGNTWAVDVILPHIRSSNHTAVWSAAMALAEIGDRRVVPLMIEAIRQDNTEQTIYGVGYYGLRHFTGVEYDKAHDGSWWADWWQKNQARFMAQK